MLDPEKTDQQQQQHGPGFMGPFQSGGNMMKTYLEHPLIQELLEQGGREHQLSGPKHVGQGQTQRQSGGDHMLRARAKWRHLMEVTMKQRRPKMIREARPAPPPDVLDTPPPPLPSGYPYTDEEWRQVNSYEQWLVRKSTAIKKAQIRYNLREITKLKKQKKLVQQRQNSKQMTAQDTAELKGLTSEITVLRSRNLWPGRKPEQSSPLDLSIPRLVTRVLEIKDY